MFESEERLGGNIPSHIIYCDVFRMWWVGSPTGYFTGSSTGSPKGSPTGSPIGSPTLTPECDEYF